MLVGLRFVLAVPLYIYTFTFAHCWFFLFVDFLFSCVRTLNRCFASFLSSCISGVTISYYFSVVINFLLLILHCYCVGRFCPPIYSGAVIAAMVFVCGFNMPLGALLIDNVGMYFYLYIIGVL